MATHSSVLAWRIPSLCVSGPAQLQGLDREAEAAWHKGRGPRDGSQAWISALALPLPGFVILSKTFHLSELSFLICKVGTIALPNS